MGRKEKTYKKIMSETADGNIDFNDFRYLLISWGFKERIKGDHHFMSKVGIQERINIQPAGNKAKPYQIKQVRELIKKYKWEA